MDSKRGHERHSLGFEVEVFSVSETETRPIEKGILHDISGSGACFMSKHPELYSIGQHVVLEIRMPGTQKASARMQGRATIAWIGGKQAEADKQQTSIGVSMDSLLSFQENPMDTNADNNNPESTQ